MIPKSKRLYTESLVLRIPAKKDIPHIFSAAQVEGFTDGMQWSPPQSEAECLPSFERSIKAWEKQEAFTFSLEHKKNGFFIGRISIRPEEKSGVWNIGFWTHPDHQGQGFMSEAVAAVIQFGFEKLEARRIEACYALWNVASEKVLKKNGMGFIRYLEKGFQKNGVWVAENLLGINKRDWLQAKSS